jgi:hypothetical protein
VLGPKSLNRLSDCGLKRYVPNVPRARGAIEPTIELRDVWGLGFVEKLAQDCSSALSPDFIQAGEIPQADAAVRAMKFSSFSE